MKRFATRRKRPGPSHLPTVDRLEDRRLLSAAASSVSTSARVARAEHKYHEYVSELQHVELQSRATPGQALELRDAARLIGQAASGSDVPLPVARARAVAATLQLDRAPLDGWLGEHDWDVVRQRLGANLDGLGVPAPLIDRTVAAMRAIASPAGVSYGEYEALLDKEDSYRVARNALPNGSANLPDPDVYYTQHLRGFFRGGAVLRRKDQARLESDIRTIAASSTDPTAAAATLRKDARLLEKIGAATDSDSAAALGDRFVATFDHGPPSDRDLADLKASLRAILVGATASALDASDQLAADAGAFFQAAGGSQEAVRTIVAGVRAVVADGGDASLNPFLIRIVRDTSSSSG